MSEFSKLDRQIAAAEKEMLAAAIASEELKEQYFQARRRNELKNKRMQDMNWQDVHDLNEMQHTQKSNVKKSAVESDMSTDEKYQECRRIITLILKARPEFIPQMRKIEILIDSILEEGSPEVTTESEEEITTEPEGADLKKSWECVNISKSDPMIVEGFCASNVLDKQGHTLNMNVLKNALPEFLEHSTLMLGHTNRPVGKIIDYEFRKTDNGHDGLWISARLYAGCADIAKEIGKSIHGFSIGGYATISDRCDRAKCHKDITALRLYEVSLVPRGANPDAIFTLKRHSALTYQEAYEELKRELGREPTEAETDKYYHSRN